MTGQIARAPLSGWVGLIALAVFALLVATSNRYGYDRDEFYFIVAGRHPAFGYPDQPLLVPLLSAALHSLAPGSLIVLRLPSALVSAATCVVAAIVAREIGGSKAAQIIAASCSAASGFALAVGHFVSTTTWDMLSTTLLCWLMVRALARRSGPTLLAAGIVTGIGAEAKPQVAVVACFIVGSLAVAGPRWPFRTLWLPAGLVAAVCLAAPYIVWQAMHGFPQLTVASNIAGQAEDGRAGFIPFQLVMVSPLLTPVWVTGLVHPFRKADAAWLRFLPATYFALAVAYLIGDGKAYYLASMYPAILGVGAIPVASWLARGRSRLRRGGFAVALAVSAAISIVLALPILPVRQLPGSVVMAVNPDQGETVGWPRFISTISSAWHSIPAGERAHTVIFTSNYGEAGAIDILGGAAGLPKAYSGHNAFGEWGHPGDSATHVLLIGYNARWVPHPFRGCRTLAKVRNGIGLDNDEQGLPVQLCTHVGTWAQIWPRLRHYD